MATSNHRPPDTSKQGKLPLNFVLLLSLALSQGSTSTDTGSGSWRQITVGEKIEFDLQNSPLQIQTSSSIGSGDEMRVIFFTAAGNERTGIFRLKLDELLKYRLEYCTSQYNEISVPSSLDSVEETIWKITVTSGSSGPGVSLHGNDEEILDMQLSDTVCEYGLWRNYWTKVPKKIQFTSFFQDIDIYFHPTECTGLDPTWRPNIVVDQNFPVIKGKQLHISCVGGEDVEGDNVITCFSDTLFQYTTQPICYWTKVASGSINFDLENSPLSIKTTSSIGSKDEMQLRFRNVDNGIVGGIKLKLEEPLKYSLEHCNTGDKIIDLPDSLADVDEVIWKITVASGPGIILHGNDEEIFNIQLSDTVCERNNWENNWMGAPKKIQFIQFFQDTDFYHHPIECIGLDPTWRPNIVVDQNFPVVKGKQLHISCVGDEEVEGDSVITCVRNTVFLYTRQPTCYWTKLTTTDTLNFDLQNSPLYIFTTSSIGSKQEMKMKFRTALSLKNAFTGGLRIKLEDPLKIFLEYCDSLTEISPPSSLSSVEEIIWKITVTSGPGVSLHGNSEEILDMQISDTVCTRSDWRDFWMGVPKRIEFTKLFDIGDLYHHPTECTGLDPTWRQNIVVDQHFPVVKGTELKVTCLGSEEIEGDSVITCFSDTRFQYTTQPICKWMQVKHMDFIKHDLDASPFLIKTDSSIRAGTTLIVWFYRLYSDVSTGGIQVEMSSPGFIKIFKCRNALINFGTELPNDDIKIWKITKTQDLRLIIHCNELEMLNVQLSETFCANFKINWQKFWGWGKGLQERMQFRLQQSKTDFYMLSNGGLSTEECTGFEDTWTNMKATPNFPVSQGTELIVSCVEGYGLVGDDTVTCERGKQFGYQTRPECVEQCTGFKASWTSIQLAESKFPVFKNTAVTIKCQEDFYISGDTIVTCLRDTEFTFATEPTCVEECSALKTTWINMEVNPGLPQPPGTTLTLSCVPGFELTGDREVQCREGQEFVFNNQPECRICKAGHYKDGPMENCALCVGNTISYEGAANCVECTQGTANSEHTACTGYCLELSVENSMEYTRGMVEQGTTIFISCLDGYVLIGPPAVTCGDDGQWPVIIPRCVKIGL